jgi:hypothetical protein
MTCGGTGTITIPVPESDVHRVVSRYTPTKKQFILNPSNLLPYVFFVARVVLIVSVAVFLAAARAT